MNDRWDHVKSIFAGAVEREGEAREAYVLEACDGDADLLRDVRKLLRADDGDDPLLDDGVQTVLQPQGRLKPGDTIDVYCLNKRIGSGGMGQVWLADQREPVRRTVALKVIKRGMDSDAVIARFEAERQAVALMEHPTIAKIFDAGTTAGGRPYFVMEYVPADPITTFCDRNRLSVRQRLELFIRVCEGVQHAHQKGIIHRDLKPSNLLVVQPDGERPLPKIIDFGVAKATRGGLTDRTLMTELGALIGTPEYMSPEQTDLTERDVDTRTDVYALGVVLYELLTGVLPFEPAELRDGGIDELRRRIREDEPSRPSNKVSGPGNRRTDEAARMRRCETGMLRRRLSGDLDWIVMRAMEKDRARRYGSPNELAADIRRHLADEPVLAGPPGAAYRATKFVRRHRVAVSFAAVLLLLLIGFAATMTVQARRIARERDRAALYLHDLEQIADFQASQLAAISPERMGARMRASMLAERRSTLERFGADESDTASAVTELQQAVSLLNFTNIARGTLDDSVLSAALEAIDRQFDDQPVVRARLLQSVASAYHALSLYDRADGPQAEALRLRRGALGDDHSDTLESIDRTALLRAAEGRGDEAAALYREAIEGRSRVLGVDHEETLDTQRRAGLFFWATKREDETRLASALDRSLEVLGPDHPVSIRARFDYSEVLSSRGMLDEAESTVRDAVQASRRVFGPDHELTFHGTSGLGRLLWRRGRLGEAEPLVRETLRIARATLGDDHLITIDTASTLAVLLETEGRLDEAETYARFAFESSRRTLRPDDGATLMAWHNLGFIKFKQGRFTEAESILREVLTRRRRVLGDNEEATIATMGNLAMVLVETGRAAEAEALAREAVDRGVAKVGPDHWLVGNCRGQLGLAISARGRFAEAERTLLEAHRVLVAAFDEQHERTRRVAGYLADLYATWDEAEPERRTE